MSSWTPSCMSWAWFALPGSVRIVSLSSGRDHPSLLPMSPRFQLSIYRQRLSVHLLSHQLLSPEDVGLGNLPWRQLDRLAFGSTSRCTSGPMVPRPSKTSEEVSRISSGVNPRRRGSWTSLPTWLTCVDGIARIKSNCCTVQHPKRLLLTWWSSTIIKRTLNFFVVVGSRTCILHLPRGVRKELLYIFNTCGLGLIRRS